MDGVKLDVSAIGMETDIASERVTRKTLHVSRGVESGEEEMVGQMQPRSLAAFLHVPVCGGVAVPHCCSQYAGVLFLASSG